jgi:ATP-dependent DNA helicase RecQ
LYHHDQLKSHGLHTEKSEKEWKSIFTQLILQDFLMKDIDDYGVIRLEKKGEKYLKNPYPIQLIKYHEIEKIERDPVVAEDFKAFDEILFDKLKKLRKDIAREKDIPPYIIFQDPSLEEMATTYPTTQEEMAQINGVGMGKVVKFGKQFLDAIIRYVEENEIETAKEVVVKSTVNKSKIKIHIIQQVDRKIDLDIIAEQKEISMVDLIQEIETICYSGTKLNLDYFINQVIEPDKQDEIFEYFMGAESDNIATALENCNIEDVSEEELRLMRIKFLSELAN